MPKTRNQKPSLEPQKLADRPWEGLPAELAVALREDVPRTVEEIIDEIRRAVPAYARPLEGAFGEAIRTGVDYMRTAYFDSSLAIRGQNNIRTTAAVVYYFGRPSRTWR